MNDAKLVVSILTILLPYILFSNSSNSNINTKYTLQKNSNVEVLTSKIEDAFNRAELEVFGKNIVPEPIIVPDPDPKKCVCKGSGIIIHGDGHTTECPFHPSKMFIKKLNSGE